MLCAQNRGAGFARIAGRFPSDWVAGFRPESVATFTGIRKLGLFELHAARVIGWVTLHRYTSHTFGQDIEQMLKQRWTFDEAIAQLGLMPRMRLRKVKEELWSQLDRVLGAGSHQ